MNDVSPYEVVTRSIAERFGVCPTFFTVAKGSPQVVENLFQLAKMSYLDSPFPSLFKERLFAYLSRFCRQPYCLLRHAAFLQGQGHASGDPDCPVITPQQVIELLQTPVPSGAEFKDYLALLEQRSLALEEWPEHDQEFEDAIFFACVSIFLYGSTHRAFQDELRRILGSERFDQMVCFLSFIRTAHYWTELHHDLEIDPDVKEYLEQNPELKSWFEENISFDADVDSEIDAQHSEQDRVLELETLSKNLQKEISERKRTESKLKQAESQFRTFLELAPDGILTVNQRGMIEYANAMVGSLFGYKSTEMIGMPVDLLVPKRFRAIHQHYRADFMRAPHVRPMGKGKELCGIRKDKTEFPIEISLSPIDSEGQHLVLATVRDISERKLLEEDARKKLLDLAHFSRLSTAGEMASGLAHELNQPLTAINHNCETAMMIMQKISDKDIDPDLIEILEENQQLSLRAGEIIRGLRSLVNREQKERTLVDINALVTATATLIQPEARAAEVHVGLNLSGDLPLAAMDETQVQQVLVNLERNGIESLKEAENQERELMISTKRHDAKFLKVTVSDNGAGVDTKVILNLFRPYMTTKDSGMGLGLSISRSIVESHGGRLWLESDEHVGATFHFTLPVSEQNT